MQFSTTPSVYNEYVVDLSGRAITAIQPGTSNVYTAEVFAGGRHWVTDNGSALFLGTDWLGTTRALTELSGTFAQLYTSLPWGDGLSSGGSSFDTTSQYTGKEYDPESGLYHFPARQYAPVQGRWLTPDPAGLSAMSLDSPQSWNRYAYVLNNPLTLTDPLGLDCVYINNTTGEYDHTELGDCDNSTEDRANSGYYFDGTVNQNPNLISVDGNGNVSAIVDGQLQCSGDANCAIYNKLTSISVDGGSPTDTGTISAGGLDILNNYCSARGRAKFIADWLPGGGTIARNLWNSPTGGALGFYQLPTADINRITEENSGGQTVSMHAASEGLKLAAGSSAFLSALRAQTNMPMTVGSKVLGGAANVLLIIDAAFGFAKEAQEILNCQAGD